MQDGGGQQATRAWQAVIVPPPEQPAPPTPLRQALASIQAVSRTSLSLAARFLCAQDADCGVNCASTATQSWLPGCLAHMPDTTTRSSMTLSSTSPDMRLGSPPRLVARSNSRQTGTVAAPCPIPLPHSLSPPRSVFPRRRTPRSPAPQHRGPKRPPSPSPCPLSRMEFRLCCAGRHAGRPGRRAASFRGTRSPGGFFASARATERSPRQEGGGFALSRCSPNRERDFYLNPCTVEEMVFWWVGLPGERGALGWNFSGAAGRGAALIFRMVVGASRLAFPWCGFYTGGKKLQCWD